MTSQHNLLRHHYVESMLEDYALGTLSAEEAAWVQEHLEVCPSCQHTLAPLMNAVQSLPFALPEPRVAMSDDIWDRIEQSISRPESSSPVREASPEPPSSNVRSLPPPRMRRTREWLGIAALVVLSLIGGALLGQVLSRFGEEQVESQQIAIQFTDPNITATGELRYLPDEEIFVLSVDNMPEAPEGYVYQAWLIDEEAPIPIGVMNTELGEFASAGNRDAFDAFAITVEPGPLGNEAPTSEPILVAPLDEGNQS